MAESATVGMLRVLLTMDTAQFDAAMKQASTSAKSWSKDFDAIGKQATAVGSALTKAITVPLLGIGAGAVKMASEFESSFAGVRKTVNATEPEFAALAKGLRDMAKEIPLNVNELNRVAEAAGQLGIRKEDILQFTRTMADLGVTTNLTADEAATATAQIQNIFGAAGQDVDRFGATLVALGNAGASTEKDIIAMGLRIAGAGNQVGLTQAQVLSFASALSSVGINAEAGGSAISRTFLKINDAVATGGESLDEFARVAGMSSAQFKQSFETDAAGATLAFIEGLSRLKGEGENVNATLEGLVGKNIIIKDTLLRASGAGQLLREQLALGNVAWQENTALVKEAEQRYRTFESQTKLLWAQVRDVGIELGTALLPTLRDLITVTRPLISAVASLATTFAGLPEPVRVTAIAIGALVASIGPLLWAFGQVVSAASVVVGAFTAKGIATRALTAAMATGTGAASLFSGALATLGPVAAGAATAFASWNLGKWIGEITGATDGVGKLAAKLGELIGLLPAGAAAQYDASRAAAEAAQSSAGLAKTQSDIALAYEAATTAVTAAVPATKVYGDELERVAGSAKRTAVAVADLAAPVEKSKDLTSRSLSETARLSVELQRWADINGAVLAPSIRQVSGALQEQLPLLATANTQWVAFSGSVKQNTAAAATSSGGLMDTLKGLFGGGGEGGGGGKMSQLLNQIGPQFAAAFMGPGSAGDKMKAFATQAAGTLMGMIPGVGPWLQAFSGPIIEGLSKLASKAKDILSSIFGGPSGDELAGRRLVATFEETLAGVLTDQQKAEAGGESWKETVIAIRDAYIAMGRTEEEALADAKRLWESSKQGADAAARVIEEIRRKMEQLTTGTHTIEIEYKERGESGRDLPPGGGNSTQPAGDPGLTVGTMGRFGKWFHNFGQQFPTSLHNIEAVLRPQDAMPFALDTLAAASGAGGGETTTNLVLVPVLMGQDMDPARLTDAIVRRIPSSMSFQSGPLRTGIEQIVGDWNRSYGRG